MSSANLRHEAIQAIATTEHQLNRVNFKETHIKDLFGVNVFNEEVQRAAAAQAGLQGPAEDHQAGRAARPGHRRRRRHRHEGLGHREGRHPLHPPVPAHDRPDRREARQLPAADRRRQGHHRVQRQGTGPRRAGRRRRSPPAASAPPSRPAATPPGTRPAPPTSSKAPTAPPWSSRPPSCQLDRRGPRQEDAAAALDGGAVQPGPAHPAPVRQHRGQEGLHHRRPRAGILPDRQELLLRPARPHQRRPDAVRRQAAQGPGAGRPVLRRHPRARAGLHGRLRGRAVQARRAGQDPAQRGRPQPVRDRADLRGLATWPPTTRC